MPFAVAVALVEGAAGLAQFTEATIRDPRILALAAKVRHQVDPADPYPDNYVGALRVHLQSGETLEAAQPHLRGGWREPLSDAELEVKFRANAAFGGWPETLADEFVAFTRDAFDAADLRGLARFRA